MRRTSWLLRALATTLLAAPGCAMVADVDRFEEEEERETQVEDPTNPYRSLAFSITGMTSHVDLYFQMSLLDGQGRTQFVAVSDPYEPEPNTIYYAPNVVFKTAAAASRLEFFGDMDGNRQYTPFITNADGNKTEVDHSWRIEGLAEDSERVHVRPQTVEVYFKHNYGFLDLAEYPQGSPAPKVAGGGAAVVDLVNLGAYLNKRLEVRIAGVEGNVAHTLGLYRFPSLKAEAAKVTLPGIIYEPGRYEITVYADKDGDREYDNPAKEGGDFGWRFTATAGGQPGQYSLTASFDPANVSAAGPSNVDVGPP